MPRQPRSDLIGRVFGCYRVIERDPKSKLTKYRVVCINCNAESEKWGSNLEKLKSVACKNCATKAVRTPIGFRAPIFVYEYDGRLRIVQAAHSQQLADQIPANHYEALASGQGRVWCGTLDAAEPFAVSPRSEPEPDKPMYEHHYVILKSHWDEIFSKQSPLEVWSPYTITQVQNVTNALRNIGSGVFAEILENADNEWWESHYFTSSNAPQGLKYLYPHKLS